MTTFRFGGPPSRYNKTEKLRSATQQTPDISNNDLSEKYQKNARHTRNLLTVGLCILLFGGIYYSQPNDDTPPPAPRPNVNLTWIPTPYTNIECSINNPSPDRPSCNILSAPIMSGIRNISNTDDVDVGPITYHASNNISWKLLVDKCDNQKIIAGTHCTIVYRISPQSITQPGYYHININNAHIPSTGGVLIKADL